jgi:hypothetical protein
VVGTLAGSYTDGLGLWLEGLQVGAAIDPSRTTAVGSTFLFASRAPLTSYDSQGKAELYRYEASTGALSCVSCLPTQVPPQGNADLDSSAGLNVTTIIVPTGRFSLIPNLSPDGRRILFQSPDPLVPTDTDGVQDVYQWEAQGKGTCTRSAGCLSLISSGQGARPAFLFGASESGDDVFILTADLLASADHDETPSIYDARVGGGFASQQGRGECLGEACQPAAVVPVDPSLATSAVEGAGNVHQGPPATPKCPKGKLRRHRRCVKQHHKRHHRGANPTGRAPR